MPRWRPPRRLPPTAQPTFPLIPNSRSWNFSRIQIPRRVRKVCRVRRAPIRHPASLMPRTCRPVRLPPHRQPRHQQIRRHRSIRNSRFPTFFPRNKCRGDNCTTIRSSQRCLTGIKINDESASQAGRNSRDCKSATGVTTRTRWAFIHGSEDEMAKGQMRSNREKKKPKAEKNKKKAAPMVSSFSSQLAGKPSGGKKFS